MIAEMWTIEDVNPSPLGKEFKKVTPFEPISEEVYPFSIDNPYLIPIPYLGFSKN